MMDIMNFNTTNNNFDCIGKAIRQRFSISFVFACLFDCLSVAFLLSLSLFRLSDWDLALFLSFYFLLRSLLSLSHLSPSHFFFTFPLSHFFICNCLRPPHYRCVPGRPTRVISAGDQAVHLDHQTPKSRKKNRTFTCSLRKRSR